MNPPANAAARVTARVSKAPRHIAVQTIETVVIRFAGDSGDGMQLTGSRFTNEAALAGNDLRTLPDFPAEIRAPAGTLAGVSAFQLSFSSHEVHTPGDALDVLVAMNPAALHANIADVVAGGLGISGDGVDQDDIVSAAGGRFLEPAPHLRADNQTLLGARLPWLKFPRAPQDR